MRRSICIIPARSGSKRIKNKNIIKFNNKPLIYWSIRAAIKSKCFKKIIVNSDSDQILKIAKKYNVEIFKRPKKLSLDNTPILDVIRHQVKLINKKNYKVCCMLPSSPLIDYKDLIKSQKMLNKNVKFIFPITNFSYPIDRALTKNNMNYIKFKNDNSPFTNTQNFKTFYHDAGQFYWGLAEDFLKFKNIFNSKKVKGYFIPNYRVRDIDHISDLKLAKNIFKSFFAK